MSGKAGSPAMFPSVARSFYLGKKVLVTGHTGFKGSWLAIWLGELGADVVGYSLDPPSNPSNFEVTGIRDRITHIPGDVRDLDRLAAVFDRHRPEVVFHLAAQPLVRLSYDDPKTTFDTNVGGTVNVFEAVRRTSSVKAVVNVTSDKCYENKEWVWGYRENDPIGGRDPYSASKGCAELVFRAYQMSFFSRTDGEGGAIGAASARVGNVIGGGDWGADRLIPDCIRALSSRQPVGIRNPRAVRPWQHVLDPLGGYLLLGVLLSRDPRRYSGVWNFGPTEGNHLTVAEMAEKFIGYWGAGTWQDLSGPGGLHEARLLKLNCDKAHAELNWKDVFSIEECLKMTADWYRRYYIGDGNLYAFCLSQIHDYMDRVKGGNTPA